MKVININSFLIVLFFATVSCKKGPTVISTQAGNNNTTSTTTGIFDEDHKVEIPSDDTPPVTGDIHIVEVLEVLPTDKYVYLRVSENSEEHWVATGKKEVKVGGKYFYKNGIMKTNFESKEYNRIFEKVYLVANIVPADHGGNAPTSMNKKDINSKQLIATKVDVEGSIKISEITSNPSKYNGKSVQVSGICTKINANIMGKNWIHLKDGSNDDFDFVITSDLAIPEGHQVTMKGDIVLDKDFGAGYKYSIIMENGQILMAK